MQRNWDQDICLIRELHQILRQKSSQDRTQGPEVPILQPVNGLEERPLIEPSRAHGAKGRRLTEAGTAGVIREGGLEGSAAPGAERRANRPKGSEAGIAETCSARTQRLMAARAASREEKVEKQVSKLASTIEQGLARCPGRGVEGERFRTS